jgi:hypothetical protein
MKKFIISMVAGVAILASGIVNAGTRAAFRVINESSETVVRIHVAPPSASRYGSTDLLGRSSLPPGYNVMVDPGLVADSNNECVLDVIAIGAEGSKWEKRFDVCVESSWTLIGGKRKTIQ